MKVLIFSTAYLPFVGGAELAIKEITDRLGSPSPLFRGGIKGGVSFDLITLNLDRKQKREETLGNVRVIRLSCPKILFPFLAFMKASYLHRTRSYDCVWSVMASYGGFAGLFFKYHFPNAPFVLTLQEGDSFAHIYRRAFFIWPLFKMLFTHADRITAISTYLAEWARRMGAKAHISVIPNGVDVSKFKVESAKLKVGELRQKLGIKPGDKVVITTSRLVPKNGVGDLIESLRYLPKHITLLICGTGPLESRLKLTANRYTLNTRVKFLGHIPHEQLPPYLWVSDIFCRPSRSEGMGSSFIEAMAAGLPVVATPVGGIPDFLSAPFPDSLEEQQVLSNSRELAHSWGAKITGLFCTIGNPKDVAAKIRLLLSSDELRNRIIANAVKMVREKYEWNGIARKMGEILTSGIR